MEIQITVTMVNEVIYDYRTEAKKEMIDTDSFSYSFKDQEGKSVLYRFFKNNLIVSEVGNEDRLFLVDHVIPHAIIEDVCMLCKTTKIDRQMDVIRVYYQYGKIEYVLQIQEVQL